MSSSFGPKSPWKGGEKRGDVNRTVKFSSHFGRFTVAVLRQYVGDQYGYIGSDGWEWTLVFVRNPR